MSVSVFIGAIAGIEWKTLAANQKLRKQHLKYKVHIIEVHNTIFNNLYSPIIFSTVLLVLTFGPSTCISTCL